MKKRFALRRGSERCYAKLERRKFLCPSTIIQDQAERIAVLADWYTRSWYFLILKCRIKCPIVLLPNNYFHIFKTNPFNFKKYQENFYN